MRSRWTLIAALAGLPACARGCAPPDPSRMGARDGSAEPVSRSGTNVAGAIAGKPFEARGAVMVPATEATASPILLLFAKPTGCDRWGAAELFEPHVRIRNLPRGDAPGKQGVWFDFCVRADAGGPLDCRIQSGEAWIDLEAGPRRIGGRVKGRFEGRRDPTVLPEENGRIAGAFDAILCDPRQPAGLELIDGQND